MPRIAFVFPGQGAQRVGMGSGLRDCSAAAREVFAAADQSTGLPLTEVCLAGPLEKLTDTAFAQPGVVAVSLAAWTALDERLRESGLAMAPFCCAGHSVGELAALAAAGALDLPSCFRLVAARGRLMAEASAMVDGTMAAVLGMEEEPLRLVCARASEEVGSVAQVANLNAPGQLVISGERRAVARASELALAGGARRVIGLDVSGPFHSVYMRPAAEGFRVPVQDSRMARARVPVVLNVTAHPCVDPEEIRQELVVQVTSPVRWSDSVRTMVELGCTVFVELGPGRVLSGLIGRIARVTVLNVEDEASLEKAARVLREVLSP